MTALATFARTLIGAPSYLLSFALTFANGVFSELNITASAAAAAGLGLAFSNVWLGVGLFFVFYILVRTMNGVVGVAKALHSLANLYAASQQSQQDTPQPDHNE